MLDRNVLVEISGDAERRQLAHLLDVSDATAEHEDREFPSIELADTLDHVHTRRVRHPQIKYDQIEVVEVGANVRQQLGDGFDQQGAMARGVKRLLEALTHKRCVGGDEHGLPCGRYSHNA